MAETPSASGSSLKLLPKHPLSTPSPRHRASSAAASLTALTSRCRDTCVCKTTPNTRCCKAETSPDAERGGARTPNFCSSLPRPSTPKFDLLRMTMSARQFEALLFAATLAVRAAVASDAIPAREAVKQFTVADGLEVSLFAAEPMVRNPTDMDIDER